MKTPYSQWVTVHSLTVLFPNYPLIFNFTNLRKSMWLLNRAHILGAAQSSLFSKGSEHVGYFSNWTLAEDLASASSDCDRSAAPRRSAEEIRTWRDRTETSSADWMRVK